MAGSTGPLIPSGPPPLLVLGASARAMAQSARRAGIPVHAVDLFRDRDLVAATVRATCATAGGRSYPAGLVAAARAHPPGPWCYTGALENHPDIIDRIAAERPLAGNAGAVVAAVRDHARLGEAARAADLGWPDTHASPVGLPTDGSYLCKPTCSAGGRGIARWRGGQPTAGSSVVWQRFVPGTSLAATFLVAADGPRLVGLCRQLVGRAWCRAPAFAYSGSVTVATSLVTEGVRAQLDRLGRLLAQAFRLRGLVGVDLVCDDRHRVHLIEVNPRPTASVELHERATGESLAGAHLAACGCVWPGHRSAESAVPVAAWAKAVLFAEHAVACDPRWLAVLDDVSGRWTRADGWPAVADIPRPGGDIRRGGPILTLFARAPSSTAALRELGRRAARVRALVAAAGAARRGQLEISQQSLL